MDRVSLPFLLISTPAARAAAGRDLHNVAGLAFGAILERRVCVEIAHLQVRYRKHCFAVSSRIGRHGDMILELDVGDEKLGDRVIFDADLRSAALHQRAPPRAAAPPTPPPGAGRARRSAGPGCCSPRAAGAPRTTPARASAKRDHTGA